MMILVLQSFFINGNNNFWIAILAVAVALAVFISLNKATYNNACIIKLKSFIFNNRTKLNKLTIGVLSVLAVLLIVVSCSCSYIEQYIVLFTCIIVAFLASPRAVVMSEMGMRYNLGWKENWSNIQSYEIKGQNILFITKNNKKRRISDIAEDALPEIESFLKNIARKNSIVKV